MHVPGNPSNPSDDGAAAPSIGQRRASAKADGGPAYQARREEIIKAAGTVFLARGYGATSFKEIAEEIGLDRATLYYYFASKQELFQTATGAAVARNTEAAERLAASDAPPAEKVAQVLAMVLDSYTNTDYPYMFMVLQEDVSRITTGSGDRWAKTISSLSRRYEAAVTKIFADGIEAGTFSADVPPHILTKVLLGMVNWTQRWFRADGPLTASQIASHFAHTMLHGISP